MHGTPHVHQITPPAMSAARKLLTAGQVRAKRLISKIEIQCLGKHHVLEVGALRAMVRNLCAEVAMFDPEDGSIQVEFRGVVLFVHIESEQIQANGCDISSLLSKDDKAAILCLAEEKARELMIEEAQRARDDAAADWLAERAA